MVDNKLHNRTAGTSLFPILFITFIMMHLLLVGNVRIYPFVDVPNHLALANIYRYYGQPTNQFAQFYALNTLIKPNTFHMYFCGSKIFPSVEFGNKIFFCLYIILLPVTTLFAIKKLGGNPWFAFLSFLYLYNYNVSYGFVGFAMAIPFVLLFFSVLLDHLEEDNLLTMTILTGLFMLLFFMHALAVLFALLIFISCCLYQNRYSLLKVFKKSVVVIPVAVLIVLWWQQDSEQFGGPGIIGFLFDYYKNEYLQKIALRGGLFAFDNYALFEGLWGYFVAMIFSLFVVVLVLRYIYADLKSNSCLLRNNKVNLLLIFISCSLCCFLLIPLRLPGYSFLIQRFPVFVFLTIIILGSVVSPKHLSRAGISTMCAVCLLHFVCWFGYFRDFDKENELFSRDLFLTAENGETMAGLIYDCKFRGRPIYNQFLDYYIVWKQGIATTRVIDERSFPVSRKVSKNKLPPFIDRVGEYHPYDGRYADMDYILVREYIPRPEQESLKKFDLLRSAGKWSMYKKR